MSSIHDQMNLYSVTRIALTLGPSLGFLLYLHSSILIHRLDIIDREHRIHDTPIYELHETYDFIIIGGGSAGAVLANRLSEIPQWNILLLEAGPDEISLSDLPIMFPTLQRSPFDWQYKTEPGSNYCRSMVGGQCNWPRGKVLGGSSVLNAMLYVRGNRRDYDRWAELGNPGWSYDDVLPYFKKSEDMRIDDLQNDYYHGYGGYLSVENFRYHSPIVEWFIEAIQEMGYEVHDINGEYQTGFTLSHGTLRDGLRCSTAKAFLRPIHNRPNLHISLHSTVEKILIDPNTRQANGVVFTKFGSRRNVYSEREILLSGGSINSPQLLMLSGIGPKDHLESLHIDVVQDLKVGYNLQDHVAIGGVTYLFTPPVSYQNLTCSFQLEKVLTTETVDEFTQHKTGKIYWLPECEMMGFVKTKFVNQTDDWPDIQYFLTSYADNTDGGLFGKRATGINDDLYTAVYENILYKDAFNIMILLLRPKSRGRILLKDKNPLNHPLIYPNYFNETDDLLTIVEGAKIAYQLCNTTTMKRYQTYFNHLKIPGCEDYQLLTDEYWACQAKHYTLTIYHPVGTAKMGPFNDPDAVVDSRLRVYGIKNLRVIDGSIMPFIVSGNTNAPIIMIAEKAADLIKEDWGIFNYNNNNHYDDNEENRPNYQQKSADNDELREILMEKTPKIKDLDYW